MKPHLEKIVFLDHYSEGDSWQTAEEAMSADLAGMTCTSTGWVCAENAKCLRIVANINGKDWDAADEVFGSFVIIKAAIVKRVRL